MTLSVKRINFAWIHYQNIQYNTTSGVHRPQTGNSMIFCPKTIEPILTKKIGQKIACDFY